MLSNEPPDGPTAMPNAPKAESHHASRVEALLHAHDAMHVRARKYGARGELGPSGVHRHLRLQRAAMAR
jgi:hypothetical protein